MPVQLTLPTDSNGLPVDDDELEDEAPKAELKKLPFIVIVIDELADLILVAVKEVEVYIARLAQMARAAGIRLMVATQRPSTDVLTGVIKANFPSRMSFQVARRDMLILPSGTSSLTRVHGAFMSETEIKKLTAHWKAQGAPVYDPEIFKPRDENGDDGYETSWRTSCTTRPSTRRAT